MGEFLISGGFVDLLADWGRFLSGFYGRIQSAGIAILGLGRAFRGPAVVGFLTVDARDQVLVAVDHPLE
jgi:hypothetical protein